MIGFEFVNFLFGMLVGMLSMYFIIKLIGEV